MIQVTVYRNSKHGAALLVPAVAAVLAGGDVLRAVGVDDGVLAAQGV